jgi:hypothetical protein
VFYLERAGRVKIIKPDGTVALDGRLPVFDGLADGMLSLTLDPNFTQNGWNHLNRSLPETFKPETGPAGSDHRDRRISRIEHHGK